MVQWNDFQYFICTQEQWYDLGIIRSRQRNALLVYIYIYIHNCHLTFASGTSQPGLVGGVLNSLTVSMR